MGFQTQVIGGGLLGLEAAKAAYDRALEFGGEQPITLYNRGLLRLQLGDSGALADLERALELAPPRAPWVPGVQELVNRLRGR